MMRSLKKMSESELREAETPKCPTIDDLNALIKSLVDRRHDYGTCIYAMSHAANAAFNYVASQLEVTGFQASCADLDILRRTRRMERFRIVNLDDLIYPQYERKWKAFEDDICDNAAWLSDKAVTLLADAGYVHPNVRKHWECLSMLADMEAPND